MKDTQHQNGIVGDTVRYGRSTLEDNRADILSHIVTQRAALREFTERITQPQDPTHIGKCGVGIASICNPVVDSIKVTPC